LKICDFNTSTSRCTGTPGTFNWTGGTQSGATVTEIYNGGTANINGGNVTLDSSRSLQIDLGSTLNYAPTTGNLTISNNAKIANVGTINLNNDVAILNSGSLALVNIGCASCNETG